MKTVSEKRKIELDKAIAYFMGWRIDNSFPDKGKVWRKGSLIELENTFKFSSDWNELMNVYEELNNTQDGVLLKTGCCVTFDKSYCEILIDGEVSWRAPHKEPPIPMKEFVYRCMGEFIEYYNNYKLLKT